MLYFDSGKLFCKYEFCGMLVKGTDLGFFGEVSRIEFPDILSMNLIVQIPAPDHDRFMN